MTAAVRWDTHLTAAQDEDVAFLLDTGSTLEDACARVGVEVGTYQRRHGADRA